MSSIFDLGAEYNRSRVIKDLDARDAEIEKLQQQLATLREAGEKMAASSGMKYQKTKDKWRTEELLLAYNGNGSMLSMSVRFDGNGNAVVRYVLDSEGKKTTYEKHDSASEAYNMACKKITS